MKKMIVSYTIWNRINETGNSAINNDNKYACVNRKQK